MEEIRKILVPVDFSEVAPVVAKWAKGFAKQMKAKIIVAYVLEDLSTYEGIYVDIKTLTELENTLLEGAKKSMEDFIKENFSDYTEVETVIEKGDVVETLIRIAQDQGVDLIVMGTHGRKGLDKILFGSVAEGVVKNSPIPVVTINPYRAGLIKAEED
ncbi:MAG: universal stress protein [Caldimicrobium sp.]|nr:universal stress protein [Caldimicrobium sp.]MCX7873992.1 universal stress protein [Caldimicrobium sp.]MDW8094140.1 universal stress protein [Caldimicrobium sp.]